VLQATIITAVNCDQMPRLLRSITTHSMDTTTHLAPFTINEASILIGDPLLLLPTSNRDMLDSMYLFRLIRILLSDSVVL